VALFGWKKSGASDGKTATAVDGGSTVGGDGTGEGGGSGRGKSGDQEFVPQPDKARRWFDYARTAADSANFEYALHCYASGIKLDPEVMSAHESMFEVAVKFMNKGGEPAKGKDIKAVLGGDTHDVAKFAAAEFEWMRDIANATLATRTLDAAIKAGQREYGHWISPRVLNVLRRGKKLSKGTLVKAKDLFKQVSAWDQALEAGQLAMQLDPTDNALDHELKDLSAQRAMDAGGYEKAVGQEGGFRTFVKDADRQRQLIESEAIVGNQSMEERNLLRAKAEYEKSPRVPDVINQYAQLVKKKGTPEAEQLAQQIYSKGFQDTGEYRFRMAAGDIKLEQLRREYEGYQSRSDENAADANLKAIAEAARKSLLDAEAAEYSERVSKYPTDRHLKLRLGEIEFGLGNFESAQRAFQAAKDEPKLRVRAGHMLGRCFAAEGWHMEAISEYKEALAHIDATEKERELAIRYDLMVSLIEQARSERDSGLAKEALEICSGIIRKDIGYRDIRAKRKDIDQLLKEISGG
jgi:tetratricopeptide (TPR) repeat protein